MISGVRVLIKWVLEIVWKSSGNFFGLICSHAVVLSWPNCTGCTNVGSCWYKRGDGTLSFLPFQSLPGPPFRDGLLWVSCKLFWACWAVILWPSRPNSLITAKSSPVPKFWQKCGHSNHSCPHHYTLPIGNNSGGDEGDTRPKHFTWEQAHWEIPVTINLCAALYGEDRHEWRFLENVDSRWRSLYAVARPSVICLSVLCL